MYRYPICGAFNFCESLMTSDATDGAARSRRRNRVYIFIYRGHVRIGIPIYNILLYYILTNSSSVSRSRYVVYI